MQICVRILSKETITLDVVPTDSIDNVMLKIHRKTSIPAREQRLLFAGKQLQLGFALSDYNILDQSSLELLLRLRGGGNRSIFTRGIWVNLNFAILTALSLLLLISAYHCLFDLSSISPVWSTLRSWVHNNQLLQTFVFGTLSTSAYFLSCGFYNLVIKRLYSFYRCEITIQNTDTSYRDVIVYVTEKFLKNQAGATSNMQVTTLKKSSWKQSINGKYSAGKKTEAPKLEMTPNDDSAIHFFSYKGYTITLFRKKGQTITVGWERRPISMEYITLSMWGRDSTVLLSLLEEAVQAAIEKQDEGTAVYFLSNSWSGGWEKALSKRPRPLDSLIVDVNFADGILQDARKFLSSEEWYANMGIPYRRGYLLYGPPGCGKTTFVQVLASQLKLDICILNLNNKDLTDNTFASYLREAPEKALILLEDVDAIFTRRSPTTGNGSESVSFSGLLNALDGVAAQEGRIFFMTTNHIEQLDPALIRPGRCDIKVEVRNASKVQLEKMFLRFFPGEEQEAAAFAASLPEDEISMAQLQGYFLKHQQSAEDCVRSAASLLAQSRGIQDLQERNNCTISEYLRKISAEDWAFLFTQQGMFLERDLLARAAAGGMRKLSDLTHGTDAVLLGLDYEARNNLARLLQRDDFFMQEHLAVADSAFAREAFLSAFGRSLPENQMVEHEEDVDSYLLRNEANDDDSHNLILQLSHSADRCGNLLPSVSRALLEQLARKFSSALADNNKISRYQLRAIVDSFPNRPADCVLAARKLTETSNEVGQFCNPVGKLTLIKFLKRCGALPYYHDISKLLSGINFPVEMDSCERGGTLLHELLNKKDSIALLPGIPSHVKKFICSLLESLDPKAPSPLPMASDGVSVVPSKEMILISLPSKARVIKEFVAFYSNSKKQAFSKSLLSVLQPMEIEELAFVFSCRIMNGMAISSSPPVAGTAGGVYRGYYSRAPVSLLELRNFFASHKFNPLEVLDQDLIDRALLDWTIPENVSRPSVVPSSVQAKWVYRFLLGQQDVGSECDKEDEKRNLADKYSASFISEGMGEESEWLTGPAIDDSTLKYVIKVQHLGERRRIIHMHQQLLQKEKEKHSSN